MPEVPKTRYARTSGANIAYQVFGDGPDLLVSYGFISNVELLWEYPPWADLVRRMARFARVIHFDKRGVGLSDRGAGWPTVDERMDDLGAVLEAAGSERAHLFGESEGGPVAMQYAAMRPERVSSLITYGTFARILAADDHPIGVDPAVVEALCQAVESTWGDPSALGVYELWEPGADPDPEHLEDLLRWHRRSASPREAADALRRGADIDVRSVLPSIGVPTLVLHREEDVLIPFAAAEHLAANIPGARLVALPGDAHTPWAGDVDLLLRHIEEWVTGEVTPPAEPDRVLATVLFTDIVESTTRAAGLGDRAWRALLDRHDDAVAREVRRHQGVLVKTTGDGALATFDGPGRGVRAARAIVSAVRPLGLEARVGVHTGEVERRGSDIGGIGVHIAARVAGRAAPSEVLVSSTVRDLVMGSDLQFRERGEAELKGVPGTWRLYAADG